MTETVAETVAEAAPGAVTGARRQDRLSRIVRLAEAHFGERVRHVSLPGGAGRSSVRLLLSGRSVIATMRADPARTRLEAAILEHLGRHCDDTPKCLGLSRGVLFQSDVGHDRLSQRIALYRRRAQADLAARAVAAIFRYQRAAQRPGMTAALPHLGTRREWLAHFVGRAGVLCPPGERLPPGFDVAAACAAAARPARVFVKWDCRAGNAAIGGDDRLRWFDFEYAGLRHGAEDVAWLIADETWPVPPATMAGIVADAFDPAVGGDRDDYMAYLALYTTFHALHRLCLILREAAARGWQSKARVREMDDAGVHPDFVLQLLRTGGWFAARNRITAPLAPLFEDARARFRAAPDDTAAAMTAAMTAAAEAPAGR